MLKPRPEQITAWVEANFTTKPRKNGAELCICSPFDGDTGFNFNISINKATCHDWRGDGWANGGPPTFLRFVQVYRNCSFVQAVQEVSGKTLSLKAIEALMRKRGSQVAEEPEVTVAQISLPSGSQPLLSSKSVKMAAILKGWLNSRGISDEVIERYNIHHTGGEVVWPYYEYDELVYWQSRNRLNKIFRFPPESVGVTKGMFIYGFDMIEPSDYLALTEAILGSISVGAQCGATGGASFTSLQVRKIRALNPVKGVILAPDNDKAGLSSIASNYHMLKQYFKVFYSIPPKLEFIKDGERQLTKDWNEIAEHFGADKVRGHFENNIKPLLMSDLLRFT